MKKGAKVKWVAADGVNGSGEVLTNEVDGHVLVAVDAPANREHRVIYCAVTWLTAAAKK